MRMSTKTVNIVVFLNRESTHANVKSCAPNEKRELLILLLLMYTSALPFG